MVRNQTAQDLVCCVKDLACFSEGIMEMLKGFKQGIDIIRVVFAKVMGSLGGPDGKGTRLDAGKSVVGDMTS